MKKKHKVMLFLLLLSGSATAQDSLRNIIKVNVLSVVFQSINLSYERAIGSKSGLQIGGYYTFYRINGTRWTGFAIVPEYRYYLNSNQPKESVLEGFYLAPFLRYQNLQFEFIDGGQTSKLHTWGGGLVIGHQWVWKPMVLDAFLGPSFDGGSPSHPSDVSTDRFAGLDRFRGPSVRLGVKLGFGF